MKFTDTFFAFPIKIYDGFSLKKALEREEKEDSETPEPIDWISGVGRLPAKEIRKISWYDGFSREMTVEQAAKNGFDQTIIVSPNYGDFTCVWPRKKFEEKLNEFMDKINEVKKDLEIPE
jgi:hypothetical protein